MRRNAYYPTLPSTSVHNDMRYRIRQSRTTASLHLAHMPPAFRLPNTLSQQRQETAEQKEKHDHPDWDGDEAVEEIEEESLHRGNQPYASL
jgi:hypothetical protein